ncbi:MAG: glycosyltransferase family 39 protein [Lachnospiraceae bacterium]|nr:glycosyltransferase family 39 protein [Lachnospiraceae bacterium]
MQAVIFELFMPILPLLCQRIYNKGRKEARGEVLIRYCIYAMLINLLTSFVMALMCDEGTSFMEKMDVSASFAFKYILVTAAAAFVIATVEWLCTSPGIRICVQKDKFLEKSFFKIIVKYIIPSGLYLLALLVAALNFILIFDNVLWGDEAYAANLIRNNISGIFQVLTLEENHPPLYYLWLKMFAEIFGYSGPVYHFASYVPFIMGIIMAVTLVRKHIGKMSAAFFVIISGLSASCVQYNMEVRMYELAFIGIFGCFYCAYRIMEDNKPAAWAGIVIWALVASYSHYYALVAAGIMMFVTFAAAYIKYRGKEWIKGIAAMALFVAAYAPWLTQLFRATKSVSGNWWMTEIETLENSINMLGCGSRMSSFIIPAVIIMLLILLAAESGILLFSRDGKGVLTINVVTPSLKGWSAETCASVIGFLSIAGTMIFAYGLSIFMRPLISVRYFYPLCSIIALMLGFESHSLFRLLGRIKNAYGQRWAAAAGKVILFLFLLMLFIFGIQDYMDYRSVVIQEKERTEGTLELIGEPVENMQFINDGVTHIGWTVLHYYYPDAIITNGGWGETETDNVWYCTYNELNEDYIAELEGEGYKITFFGEVQLSKYPFLLYHYERGDS